MFKPFKPLRINVLAMNSDVYFLCFVICPLSMVSVKPAQGEHFPIFIKHSCDPLRLTTRWLSDSVSANQLISERFSSQPHQT